MLLFTLSGVNVSLANAIRRTILSDIPLIVFRTSPHEQNKANIILNTTRLNNEILKQRLSCIPIHIKDYNDFEFKNIRTLDNVDVSTGDIIYYHHPYDNLFHNISFAISSYSTSYLLG
jgi:DNA-directed RNA polymerase alpha subunit